MSRRGRALAFAAIAIVCAGASAALASGYRDSLESRYGEQRPVVAVVGSLKAGEPIGRRAARRRLEARRIPAAFAPADALADPLEALDLRPHAAIPAGSYLLASQLREPGGGRPRGARLSGRLRPVTITVSGAAALARLPRSGAGLRVDVVVAEEAAARGADPVRVVAERVRLIALERGSPNDPNTPAGEVHEATLALGRGQALELIEAENYAREVRLIPR